MSRSAPAAEALDVEYLCSGLEAPAFVKRFEHLPGGGKVVFGPGTISRIGEEVAALGVARVLVVTDPGIVGTGFVDRARRLMEAEGLAVEVFADVHENPTTEDVDRCVACAREFGTDLIVGLGGGSSLDTAKGCNFILSNGGVMQDYRGVGKARLPMLPFVAVPTTSGTGSECQSFALIADAASHAKMACGDPKAAAALAILDPELTLTMPAPVTAHTGIDAIAHALETAVCRKRNEVSSAYSLAAWRLLDTGFERVLDSPGDLAARARMQLGAAFAGMAIENSMLGVAHSCANPLTAHYGIVHGQAVGTMLPAVVEFNRADPEAAGIYLRLDEGGDVAERVRHHLRLADMGEPLSAQGVREEDIPMLAREAAVQWTAQFNPVEAPPEALEGVYRSAW